MWKIMRDHLAEEYGEKPRFVGTKDFDPAIATTPFKLYDDDGILYYSGRLYDDPDAENQYELLMWAAADSGCTTIKVKRDGKYVQDIG